MTKTVEAMQAILEKYVSVSTDKVKNWVCAGPVDLYPDDGGKCFKYKGKQIAIFSFSRRNKWYACQNLCPHKFEMVLSRGMTGDAMGEPKVACPLHKANFSLETGKHLNGDLPSIATYPVEVRDGTVYIGMMD